MKAPKNKNWGYKLSVWLYRFNSGWLSKLILNLIVVVPPAVIASLYSNESVKNGLKLIAPDQYPWIASLGHNNVLIFNTLAFLWPLTLIALGNHIAARANENGLNVATLFALIKSLDSIVGIKNKRFHTHTKNTTLTNENAFETITDPNSQIAEIVKEIGVFFNAINNEKKTALIRVTLAVMKDGLIDSIPIFYPNDEPIKSSLDRLNTPSCAFIVAAKSKRTILISDIKKELKKGAEERQFAETDNEEDNVGSMICFPIKVYDASIPFVVSIHCDEAGYFKEEYVEFYEHTLQRFALRLSVENSLLILKEKLCDN